MALVAFFFIQVFALFGCLRVLSARVRISEVIKYEHETPAKTWLDTMAKGSYGGAVRDAMESARDAMAKGEVHDYGGFTAEDEMALFRIAFHDGWGAYDPNRNRKTVPSWRELSTEQKRQLCQQWVKYVVAYGTEGPGFDPTTFSDTPAGHWLKKNANGPYGRAVRDAMAMVERGEGQDYGGFTSADEKALFQLAFHDGWGQNEPNSNRNVVAWHEISAEQRHQLCQAWVKYVAEYGNGGPGFTWEPTAAIRKHEEELEAARRTARLVWKRIPEPDGTRTQRTPIGGKEYFQPQKQEGLYDPERKQWSHERRWVDVGVPWSRG